MRSTPAVSSVGFAVVAAMDVKFGDVCESLAGKWFREWHGRWLLRYPNLPRIVLAVGLGLSLNAASPPKPVYPGETWASKTPGEVGMDGEKLSSLAFGHAGCIVRYGYMIKTWGNPASTSAGGSEVKPFFTHFLFKAVEEGRLRSENALVSDFEPRLKSLNPALGYKDRRITFGQMARQISCYGVQEAPGTAFDYNDFNMALFGDTLYFKVYGATSWQEVTERILRPKLTAPMQWQDNQAYDIHGRLRVSLRDDCRFGLLYLRHGKWNGRGLLRARDLHKIVNSSLPGSFPRTKGVPADLIPGQRRMGDFQGGINQTDHFGSYSDAWWTNGITREGKRRLPDAPPDLYGCEGGNSEVFSGMFVFPSLDLIVAWRSALRGDTNVTVNGFFKTVLSAVKDYTPPAQR